MRNDGDKVFGVSPDVKSVRYEDCHTESVEEGCHEVGLHQGIYSLMKK